MTIALTGIPGIGPGTAKILLEKGFTSADEIAKATIAQLVSVPGFSTARANRTINAATELLAASAEAANSTTQAAPSQPRTAKKPIPKSPASTTADDKIEETETKKPEKGKAKKAAAKAEAKAAKKAAAKEKAAAKAAAKAAKKSKK